MHILIMAALITSKNKQGIMLEQLAWVGLKVHDHVLDLRDTQPRARDLSTPHPDRAQHGRYINLEMYRI